MENHPTAMYLIYYNIPSPKEDSDPVYPKFSTDP